MSSKELIITSSLNANSSDIIEFPIAIPLGKTWIINNFGAADSNFGDNKSTDYILRFGNDVKDVIMVTGSTYNGKKIFEIIGDGIKKLNVVRRNHSNTTKECPFWINGYERS